MTIKNINVNKDFFKKLNKSATACVLATAMLFGLTACDNSENNESEIGFEVEKEVLPKYSGLYTYIINEDGLSSSKYDFSDNYMDLFFAKVSESEEYGTNLLNERMTAFYRKNMKLILPDCYGLYNSIGWFSIVNFDYDLKIEKLDTYLGGTYTVIYSSMKAKRDLTISTPVLYNGQEQFKKGDTMSSIAIYFDEELVGYKQTGVGSECSNIIESTVGDVDLALTKISDAGILTETTKITGSEMYEYEEKLNTDNSVKTNIIH